jgi:hypothetical protein
MPTGMGLLNKTEQAQRRFLAVFRETGSILQTSRATKLSRTHHYEWMRTDREYQAEFKLAEADAAQALLDEAVRRARFGVKSPVLYNGKVVRVKGEVLYEYKYSDTLMQFLLKGLIPDVFHREKMEAWDGDLGKLTDEQLAQIVERLTQQLSGGDVQKVAAIKRSLLAIDAPAIDVTAEVTDGKCS